MSDKKTLIEAYIEDNKVQVKVIETDSKGLPFLTYASKLIDMEITRRLIEQTFPESDIIVPQVKIGQ